MVGEEQQQPPLHMFEAQSKWLAQESPGLFIRHEPVFWAHPEQPERAALKEQQKPDRHAPDRQRPGVSL